MNDFGEIFILLHLFQDLLHPVQGDLFPVLVEDLDEAAHVGPLEVVGKIHIEVDPGHGVLEFPVLVHDYDGVGDILYPHLIDGYPPVVPGFLHVVKRGLGTGDRHTYFTGSDTPASANPFSRRRQESQRPQAMPSRVGS